MKFKRSLREFYRILKPKGRIIVFWPPEFGLSVIFFKILSFIFKNIFRKKNIKFHPTEITRLRSRQHAADIFHRSRFHILQYYFGIKDLFTYAVIVVEKE